MRGKPLTEDLFLKNVGEKIAYCNAFEKNWDTSSKFIGLHLDWKKYIKTFRHGPEDLPKCITVSFKPVGN